MISDQDFQFIKDNIGRTPRGAEEVVARCPSGHPLVVRVRSIVDEKPFPTMYWLVCREVCKQVDRIEASGIIKELENNSTKKIEEAISSDHREYILRRKKYITPEERDTYEKWELVDKGVGGLADHKRIRCLHMFFAYHFVDQQSKLVASLENQIDLPELCM